MSRGEYIAAGAVVLFQSYDFRVGKVFFKVEDISYIRASPLVDALIVVADNAYIFIFAREELYYPVLDAVCILIFIYHYVTETILIIFEDRRMLFQKMQGVTQQIVKVHGVVLFESALVTFVGVVDYSGPEVFSFSFDIIFRIAVVFFFFADYAEQIIDRVFLGIYVLFF